MSTAYHAKYFAYELTKQCAADSVEKIAASFADAQVDLNPHQIEAALFAFRSPLSGREVRFNILEHPHLDLSTTDTQ
jgi:hypothetical protein